jgi:hypothetical protein
MSDVKYKLKENPETTLDVILTSTTDNKLTTITVPMQLIAEINGEIDKRIYYREDVLRFLQNKIASGDIPETVLSDESCIATLIDAYAEYRNNAEGDTEGMNWYECLFAAYVDWTLNQKGISENED